MLQSNVLISFVKITLDSESCMEPQENGPLRRLPPLEKLHMIIQYYLNPSSQPLGMSRVQTLQA